MSRRSRERRRNIAAVLIVLVFAAFVFSVNAVGRFVAEKVIRPVVTLTEGKDPVQAREIRVGEFVFYAAAELVSSDAGKAGAYPYGDSFAVIDRVFEKKEDAAAFGGQVLTYRARPITLRVTGTSAQAEALEDALSVLTRGGHTLLALSASLAAGDVTRAELFREAAALRGELADARDALPQSEADIPGHLKKTLEVQAALLSSLPEATSDEFLPRFHSLVTAYCCGLVTALEALE